MTTNAMYIMLIKTDEFSVCQMFPSLALQAQEKRYFVALID